MQDRIKVFGEKKFESPVRKETAYGVVEDYGKQESTMRLMRVGDNLLIEWVIGKGFEGLDYVDYTEIGIKTVGHEVIEYDGVFEIPEQAITLLQECDFNTKEIEREKNDF